MANSLNCEVILERCNLDDINKQLAAQALAKKNEATSEY